MVDVGSRGFNLAANAVVTAAVKGQTVVTDKLRAYSTMDLTKLSDNMAVHSQPGGAFKVGLFIEKKVLPLNIHLIHSTAFLLLLCNLFCIVQCA